MEHTPTRQTPLFIQTLDDYRAPKTGEWTWVRASSLDLGAAEALCESLSVEHGKARVCQFGMCLMTFKDGKCIYRAHHNEITEFRTFYNR